MAPSSMVRGIGLLLGFQLAGEVAVRLLQVQVPGPIVGLLLLFAWLKGRAFTDLRTPEAVDKTAVVQITSPLLRNLAILFVPSGVGVVEYLDLFTRHGAAILFVVVASTLATLAITALAFTAAQSLARSWRSAQSNCQPARGSGASSVSTARVPDHFRRDRSRPR